MLCSSSQAPPDVILPLQSISLNLPIQGRPLDIKNRRRLALVPVCMRQRMQDVPLLDLLQRQRFIRRRCCRPTPACSSPAMTAICH